jgi:fatty acid desaturase
VSGLPYWGAQAQLLAQLVRGRATAEYLPQAARPRIIAEARLMALGYLAVIAFSLTTPVLVWVWLVPVVLGQPVLRLYLLAEHGDCPQVADMFLNTRTTLTTRMVRFLAWNMPFHAEHHILPQVPFHHLPDLHLLMRENLRQTAPGYLAFTRDFLARRRAPPA